MEAPTGGDKLNWTTRGDGHEHARYHGTRLRMRRVPTGWIISRRDYDGWLFVAGDTRREVAIRKAEAILND